MQTHARFEMRHHATMLADTVRLDAYRTAMTQLIGSRDTVVDIGTGTGILASYAASLTRGTVYGLEYFIETAALASHIVNQAGLSNLRIINTSSYHHPIEAAPDTLVTETIGPLGPEECIVEICYEFCCRYPTIRTVVPQTLQLFAQPIYSRAIDAQFHRVLKQYYGASHGSFDYRAAATLLEKHHGHEWQWDVLSDTVALEMPRRLVSYELGKTRSADFETIVPLAPTTKANAVHFFFHADLGANIALRSHFSAPLTHWQHCFIRRPRHTAQLAIRYESQMRRFHCHWR